MIIKLDPKYQPILFKDVPNGGVFSGENIEAGVFMKIWNIIDTFGNIINYVNIQTGKDGTLGESDLVIYHSAAILNLYG